MRQPLSFALICFGLSAALCIGYFLRPSPKADTPKEIVLPVQLNEPTMMEPVSYSVVQQHFQEMSSWRPLDQLSYEDVGTELAPMPRVK